MEKIRTIIKPPSSISINVKELWQYRELLYFFTWRDIKVKYKQTVLGIFWALLQPLALMLIFVLIFSRSSIAQTNSNLPYPLFVLSGLVIWNLFHSSVAHAADSMVVNSNIIKKIYFPRLIIPISTIFSALIDFVIAFIILIFFLLFYQQPVHLQAIIFFPAAIILCLITAFGLGTLLSALNVKFRDFRYALPFFLQLLFFATQIIYPVSIIKEQWLKYIFALNPMNAVIALFRHSITNEPLDMILVFTGVLTAFLLAIIGLLYFKKTESYFADIV